MKVKKCITTGKTTLILDPEEFHDLQVMVDCYAWGDVAFDRKPELKARYEFEGSFGNRCMTHDEERMKSSILGED